MMKFKLQSIFRLTFLLFFFFFVAIKSFSHDFVVNGIYYNKNADGNTVSVTYNKNEQYSGKSYSGDVVIPSSVTYGGKSYTVTEIGKNAFDRCQYVTSVSIPNTMTHIGAGAFFNCSGLTSITLPNSVKTIDGSAFYNCWQMSTVTLSNAITTIAEATFSSCSNLKRIVIPNSVTSIQKTAFSGCSKLEDITVPASVIEIGREAFHGTAWLSNQQEGPVYIGSVLYQYKHSNPIPYGTSVAIRQGILSITESAFEGCSGLTNVTFPNTLKTICQGAFRGCSDLVNIIIPNSVVTIEQSSFVNCYGLEKVVIGNMVSLIGGCAFENCYSLKDVTFGKSIIKIESGAFYECRNLLRIAIPESVTTINETAFYGCSSLEGIEVEDGNIVYDSRDNCNGIINTEKNELFLGCKNTIIPSSVTAIGRSAFAKCPGLTSITIPASVTTIGAVAFNECNNLMDIKCMGLTPPSTGSGSFSNKSFNNATVLVPDNKINQYSQTAYWSNFKHFREITGNSDNMIIGNIVGPTSIFFQVNQPVSDIDITLNGWMQYHDLVVTGLQPNTSFNSRCEIETVNGKMTALDFFTTSALSMTAKAADMITNRDVRLMAETNMADVETSCGFEWRRYDAPEEMPSTKVYCPVYGGTMAGTLKNLSENVYYKYRPFYKSSAGNEYYGDWVAFITADAGVEFEPVVYTYNSPSVTKTDATLQGVALRGSSEITEQGFEYWQAGHNTMLSAGGVTKVPATGERMSATVTGLTPGTAYKFRAYVIAGGKTTRGADVDFVTEASGLDVNADGVVNIADMNVVINVILSGHNDNRCDVNSDGVVNISDINTIISAILAN